MEISRVGTSAGALKSVVGRRGIVGLFEIAVGRHGFGQQSLCWICAVVLLASLDLVLPTL